eukprot:scaffold281857_cov40-Tisochrysis_lutea.AAC.1
MRHITGGRPHSRSVLARRPAGPVESNEEVAVVRERNYCVDRETSEEPAELPSSCGRVKVVRRNRVHRKRDREPGEVWRVEEVAHREDGRRSWPHAYLAPVAREARRERGVDPRGDEAEETLLGVHARQPGIGRAPPHAVFSRWRSRHHPPRHRRWGS